MSSLPDDYWLHDEATQSLTGRHTRITFRLTQDVAVRLAEASPVTGGLIFALGDAPSRPAPWRRVWQKPGARQALICAALLLGAGPRARRHHSTSRWRRKSVFRGPCLRRPAHARPHHAADARALGLARDHRARPAPRGGSAGRAPAIARSPAMSCWDRPAPSTIDAAGWGLAAAELDLAAYGQSPSMRAAGTQDLIQNFFDEMFNHLDPYSRYEPPAPAEAERTKLSVDAGAGLGLVAARHAVVVGEPGAGRSRPAGRRANRRPAALDRRPRGARHATRPRPPAPDRQRGRPGGHTRARPGRGSARPDADAGRHTARDGVLRAAGPAAGRPHLQLSPATPPNG